MKHVNLGASGLKVSRLALGCMSYGDPKWRDWVKGPEESLPFFRRALELGIDFFDTADMYSLGASEEITGRALKEMARRDDVVIATKVFNPMSSAPNDRGLSRKHVMASIDASLKRLQTDHVDLYQIHRFDPRTPIEETMEALHDVVKAGKARYLGASSMPAWRFLQMQTVAERHGWTRFVSMQPQYNLVYREEEREMIPLCLATGVGVIPWSPLARGFLAGNRKRGGGGETTRSGSDPFAEHLYFSDADFAVQEALARVASERGVSPMKAAMAWVASRPGVTAPIVGATKMEHLDDAVDALSIALTAEEVAALEAPYLPKAVNDH